MRTQNTITQSMCVCVCVCLEDAATALLRATKKESEDVQPRASGGADLVSPRICTF